MTAECRFCRIISGETPSAVVFDDGTCMAFLDHRPLFAGHCLLLPKAHYETLLDLPDTLTRPLFSNARRLCRAVEEAMQAEGTFVAINNKISQSVPHLHVHIVPRRKKDGLKGFFWPRHPYKDEGHMLEVAEKIKAALERLR